MTGEERWERFMSSFANAMETYSQSPDDLRTYVKAVDAMEKAILDLESVKEAWPEQSRGLRLLDESLKHFVASIEAYYWVTKTSMENKFLKTRRYIRQGRSATLRSMKAWQKAARYLNPRLVEQVAVYLGDPETVLEQRWW